MSFVFKFIFPGYLATRPPSNHGKKFKKEILIGTSSPAAHGTFSPESKRVPDGLARRNGEEYPGWKISTRHGPSGLASSLVGNREKFDSSV